MVKVLIKNQRRGAIIELVDEKSTSGLQSYAEYSPTKKQAKEKLQFLEGVLKVLGLEYVVKEIAR